MVNLARKYGGVEMVLQVPFEPFPGLINKEVGNQLYR